MTLVGRQLVVVDCRDRRMVFTTILLLVLASRALTQHLPEPTSHEVPGLACTAGCASTGNCAEVSQDGAVSRGSYGRIEPL